MSRRKGRILAFQAVYSWDVSKESLEDIFTFEWAKKDPDGEGKVEEFSANAREEQTFARLIASGTIDHVDEIDKLIESHLSSSWTKERLNKVTLAILRTSIYEMKFQAGTQAGIIIDEALNISREFGTDDSYKFINAVLDKIGKDESIQAKA